MLCGFGLFAEVGEVEGGSPVLSPDAGHELTDFHLRFHSVDMHDIVKGDLGFRKAGTEGKLDMQAYYCLITLKRRSI